jgi:alkylation response protein AidB-like acyl-CoA dehydrogenase
MEVPVEFGGASASFSTRMRVCEELALYHAGFAFSLVNHHNVVSRIAQSGGSEVQRELIAAMLDGSRIGCTAMTEPQSGSDFSAMQTGAVPTQDGWVLSGAKAWITNASLADVFLVYAQTDAEKGADGVAGFIVLADDIGFQRGHPYSASGIEGMGVGQFTLTNCVVPNKRLLYPPGEGFRAAMRGVNQARVHVAAMNAAMLETALAASLSYASNRQAFGAPVIEFQGLGWSLANVATHLQAMRLLAYAAADAIDAREDAQAMAAMAKKYANDTTMQGISTCMQAMGAHGITEEARLGRLLAWAKAFCYTDGTPEMMNERIVRYMRKAQRNEQ